MKCSERPVVGSVANCPLSTLGKDYVRKEDAAAATSSPTANEVVIRAGKTVKSGPAFGRVSPISTTSTEDLLPITRRPEKGSGWNLRACCCCGPRVGTPGALSVCCGKRVVTSDELQPEIMMKRGASERRASRDSINSSGSQTQKVNRLIQLFKRKGSSTRVAEQTLISSNGNLHTESPTESLGNPRAVVASSWSNIAPLDGRDSSSTSASGAAGGLTDIGSTMSLSSLPHHPDMQRSLGDSLPVLTKEPAPGKASTMPGSQMSQHANGVIGHTSSSHKPEAHGGKTSSGSSVSSGYVSSSSRYSHSSKGSSSQGLSTAADGGSARRRTAAQQTAAQQTAASVSESQRVALINAATVPADGPATSRVHGASPKSQAHANQLASQIDRQLSVTKQSTSRSQAVTRPRSVHGQEEQQSSRPSMSRSRHQPPAIPMFPMTSAAALSTFGQRLTEFEQEEILDYSDVHYLGLEAPKIVAVRNATQNHGYDEENGSYMSVMKDHIAYRFEIKEVLGKGSFGHVVKALDHRTNHYVAIKIIRNKRRFHQQAQVELKILANLNRKDRDGSYNIIRMEDSFHFRGHLCIVFELMGMNLYEVLKANNYRGFSLSIIRKITISLLHCLKLLRRENIIHCDLKPENILLRPSGHMAVKVIDFGSSCYEHQRVYTYIQSRFYRSPEVVLGLPYTCAIDMWSLGCILPELYTGYPLFPGENENEQLACIMQIKGLPPSRLLDIAPRRRQFFDSAGNPRHLINSKGKRRQPGTKSMASACDTSDPLFINFIQQCLHWEAGQRMLPEEGLRHHWILQGRQPRNQAHGYTSDTATGHNRARSGTTSSIPSSSSGQRRHHTTTHSSSQYSSSTHVSSSGSQSLQLRPQPIGAEQPSEPITKTSKITASKSAVQIGSGEGKGSPSPDSKTRHVVGATTQEKMSESSQKTSMSWSNPNTFLHET